MSERELLIQPVQEVQQSSREEIVAWLEAPGRYPAELGLSIVMYHDLIEEHEIIPFCALTANSIADRYLFDWESDENVLDMEMDAEIEMIVDRIAIYTDPENDHTWTCMDSSWQVRHSKEKNATGLDTVAYTYEYHKMEDEYGPVFDKDEWIKVQVTLS